MKPAESWLRNDNFCNLKLGMRLMVFVVLIRFVVIEQVIKIIIKLNQTLNVSFSFSGIIETLSCSNR